MNDDRSQQYLALIQELLNCPNGEEGNILNANMELADFGLVNALLQESSFYLKCGLVATAEKLTNLAQSLSISSQQGTDNHLPISEELVNFCNELFQADINHGGEAGVFAVLEKNLHLMDANLGKYLIDAYQRWLDANSPEWKEYFLTVMDRICIFLFQFPLGNPKGKIISAITCYQYILSCHANNPEESARIQSNIGGFYLSLINFSEDPKLEIEKAITCFHSALLVREEVKHPKEFADTQSNLGVAYGKLADFSEEPRREIEKAIDCFHSTLQIRKETELPQAFGDTQNNLGTAYDKLADFSANPKQEIEKAILCYQSALRIRKEVELPHAFAETQNNLGNAYGKLADFSDNPKQAIEQAISCFQSALRIRKEVEHPYSFANTENSLGNAYCILAPFSDNPKQEIERAISCYQAALRIRREVEHPQDFASTQNNLGNAYRDLALYSSNPKQEIERAISCYQAALRIRREVEHPQDFASTQHNLGNAYRDLALYSNNPKQEIEQAILCFQLALRVRKEVEHPQDFASTQDNLGNAHNDLASHSDNPRQEIEKAIICLEGALRIRKEVEHPQDFASTQHNLGAAYWSLASYSDNPKQEIEKAILCFQSALRTRKEVEHSQDFAETQNNLGAAYWSLASYSDNPKQEIEKAILCFQAALRTRKEVEHPQDFASTQHNLGTIYTELASYSNSPKQEIEKAIICLEAALRIRKEVEHPQDFSSTQNSLGISYWRLASYSDNPKQEIEKAIICLEAALRVSKEEDFPEKFANIQNNLALTYCNLVPYSDNPKQEIKNAITCHYAALRVMKEAERPKSFAVTQHNLALAYCDLVYHSDNPHKEILYAIAAFRAALRIYTSDLRSIDCLNTAKSLGNLGFKQGLWKTAIEGYSKAIEAVENIRSWSKNDDHRQEILRDAIGVYDNAIQSYINLSQYDNAIALTERARSRHLVELMASNDLYADGNIPPDVLQYLEQYEYLERRIETERQRQANDNSKATISDRPTIGTAKAGELYQQALETVKALMAEKTEIWRKLRELDPVLAGTKEVSPPDFAAMQKLLEDRPHSAIVSFYSTNEHTHIFVLRQTGVTLHTCTDQGYQNLQVYLREKWLKPYEAYRVNPSHSEWKDNIKLILIELSQRLELNQLITNHLQDIDELIIIPHIYLHLIPFAALPIASSISPRLLGENLEVQEFLSDRFRLRILPSCQILEFCQARKPTAIATYTTIENATDDLIMADFECEQIAKICNIPSDRRIQGSQNARREKIAKILLDRTNPTHLLHASHHAGSNLNAPLESALQLANQETITLGQLLSPAWRMLDLEEVFLSCCETNLTDPNINDDILTIGTGFLCAGARSVISTLWSVNAFATALFCIFYYQERNQKPEKVCDRPTAIHKAQKRLRELKGAELSRGKPLRQALNQYLNQQLKLLGNAPEYQEERLKLDFLLDRELPRLAEQAFPFEHPVYWSGFIAQGVA